MIPAPSPERNRRPFARPGRRGLALLVLSLALLALRSHQPVPSRSLALATPSYENFGAFPSLLLLGGFRAIAINLAWVRADELYVQGQWQELVAFLELIARLQPNLISVWEYNAWHLGFNLSLSETTPAQEWRWLRKALDFAVQGEELNPGSARLATTYGLLCYQRASKNPEMSRRFLARYHRHPLEEAMRHLAPYVLDKKDNRYLSYIIYRQCCLEWAHLLDSRLEFSRAAPVWERLRAELPRARETWPIDKENQPRMEEDLGFWKNINREGQLRFRGGSPASLLPVWEALAATAGNRLHNPLYFNRLDTLAWRIARTLAKSGRRDELGGMLRRYAEVWRSSPAEETAYYRTDRLRMRIARWLRLAARSR